MNEEAGVHDGSIDPDDDESTAVITALGRQLKLWREHAGLTHKEFGAALGYGENLVYKVEAGKRIPRPEYLDKADEALDANGRIAAMKKDVEQARYPKKVRDLAKLEAEAVELGAYANHNMHGLLQTEEYMRALYRTRRPALDPDHVDRFVAARLARQVILASKPLRTLTFVLEEVTLQRPVGGNAVRHAQLERLTQLAELPNVEIQVMPTERGDHAGMGGLFQVLKFEDGSAVGHWEGQLSDRLVADAKLVRILELRYGMIRAQALTPRESLEFIDKLLGET